MDLLSGSRNNSATPVTTTSNSGGMGWRNVLSKLPDTRPACPGPDYHWYTTPGGGYWRHNDVRDGIIDTSLGRRNPRHY